MPGIKKENYTERRLRKLDARDVEVCWALLLIAYAVPFIGLWPFGRPISGVSFLGLVVVDGLAPFRLPGGGSLSVATERNQRVPRDFVPGPYQGVPPGPPRGWGKRPIPSYPCGAIGRSPAGGYPLRPFGPTGPPPSGGGWSKASFLSLPGPQATSPKGSIFSAEKITEYGQLSVGRKRPDGVRWEQQAKVPSLPPPPEPIRRGRARNR